MIHCEILIIDDDQEDIDLLMEALQEHGVQKIHYVDSAVNAFHYLEEVYPDCVPGVIVTDFQLQGLTGGEFFAALRTMERYNKIKVVIMSTSKNDQQLESLRGHGDFDFYLKPTSSNEYAILADTIRNKITV